MPTEREKQAEKERVTKISGFRVGYHDLLAEIDLPALKARNDRWEAEHKHMIGWCSRCGDTLFPMANKPLFLQ